MTHGPYGPNTAAIRRFLVRLAGLGTSDRATVVAHHETVSATVRWQRAEQRLGTAIERSGREAQRDALSGPLLQLVRPAQAPVPDHEDAALAALDPIAEPALAALLALLVRDLLTGDEMDALYAPFADVVPFSEVVPVAPPAESPG